MFSLPVATVALALLGATASIASPVERQACAPYEIVTARGTTTPQTSTSGFTGMLTMAQQALPQASRYDVVYPASIDFYNSIQAGIKDLTSHIAASVQACPNKKYAFIGYSQGAEVMNNYLQNVTPINNTNIYNLIQGIVYIGNPSHSPNRTSNFDQDGGKTTNPYTGGGILGVRTPPLLSYINSGKLHDICYIKDIICGVDQTNATLDAHLQYDTSQSVQNQGSTFIVSKLSPFTP